MVLLYYVIKVFDLTIGDGLCRKLPKTGKFKLASY
jgi:hypothetical protein